MVRRARRSAAGALAAVAATVLVAMVVLAALPARAVFAHADLESSEPADGSVLQQAPAQLLLHFSEPVLAEASSVTLIRLGEEGSQRLPVSTTGDGSTVVADLPDLPDGGYLARFVAVDPADLHKTVGTISFGIGQEAPPSEAGGTIDSSSWLTALRSLVTAILIATVGAVVVLAVAVAAGTDPPRRPAAIAMYGPFGVALGWIALLLADVADVGWSHANWGRLILGSDPGRRALVGIELAAGLWWVVRLLRRCSPESRAFVARIGVALAAAFVLMDGFGGHSSVGGPIALGVALRVVHIGAVSAWLGGVGVLWWSARGEPGLATLWPRVSVVAAWGIGLTGITGLLASGRVVTSVTALLDTVYGRSLVGKMAALLVLGAIGALAARRVAAGARPRRIALELGVAAVAVVLAAVLGGTAPAVGARYLAAPEAVPQVVTGDIDDLTVSVDVEPARPGPNLLRVRVLDTRKPPPAVVQQVTVRLRRGDGEVVDTRTAAPVNGVVEWSDVALTSPGRYTVEVDTDRPDLPVPSYSATVEIAPTPVPRAATVVSDARWWPFAVVAAVVWVLLALAGRRVVQSRRGRRDAVDQGSNR